MKKDDEHNYLELINRQQTILYAVCWHYSDGKEDRMKELYVEVTKVLWNEYTRFGLSRYNNQCNESTWVYRIAQHAIEYYLRQQYHLRKNSLLLSQNDIESLPIATKEKELIISNEDKYSYLLTQLIHHLNDIDQQIIHHYLEGLSYAEIGNRMQMSESAIGTRMSRIIQRLKKINKQINEN